MGDKKDTEAHVAKAIAGELTSAQDKTEPAQLPRWAKIAIAQNVLLGMPFEESLIVANRTRNTFNIHKKSLAGKKWRAAIQAVADDPIKVAQLILRSGVSEAAIDFLGVIQSAKDVGDYKEVRLATKDLLRTHELLTDARQVGGNPAPVVLQINLGNMAAEIPTVEVEYEEVIEAEVEEIDD